MKKKNELRDFYYHLPLCETKIMRDAIISRCKITSSVFQNWLSGRTQVPELAKEVINEIADMQVFKL